MFMQTHSLISQAVASVIQERLNFTLNKDAFQYGSIKPDFYPHLMLMPHYKESSSDIIYKRIQDLQHQSIPLNAKALKHYSLELGVINHFLADYFCAVHNEDKKSALPSHLFYEHQLARKFANSNIKEISSSIITSLKKTPAEYKSNLVDYINKRHIEYLNRPSDMAKDIYFSLEVCIVASSEILLKSMASLAENIA